MNRDITNLIERLELFEERLGVRLEGLYAEEETEDRHCVTVNGEIHSRSGNTIKSDMEIHTTLYDAQARVINTKWSYISAEKFFGFEAFHEFFVDPPNIAKIRIYPKVS